MLAIEFGQPKLTRPEHELEECVRLVVSSPTACRRVLKELTQLARSGGLVGDPTWEPALDEVGRFADALDRRPASRSRFQR